MKNKIPQIGTNEFNELASAFFGGKPKPKQEPFKHKVEVLSKEEIIANRSNAYEFIDFDKQETLEEVAERLTNDFPTLEVRFNMTNEEICGWFLEALQKGAKYQQEQIYNLIKELYDNEEITGFTKRAYAQCLDIIEQFKNK